MAIRQGCRIAMLADGDRRLDPEAIRDAEVGLGLGKIDARHAMGDIAHHRRLQRQLRPGRAGIEAVAV